MSEQLSQKVNKRQARLVTSLGSEHGPPDAETDSLTTRTPYLTLSCYQDGSLHHIPDKVLMYTLTAHTIDDH